MGASEGCWCSGKEGIIIPEPEMTRGGNLMEGPGRGSQMLEWCL